MLSEYSSGIPNEIESEVLDINESFVRSDIADIISKMYTPLSQWTGEATRNCDSLQARERVWQVDEVPKKRFGFYFETISARNNHEASRDSSTSDVVSLPSVKSRQKPRNGFVCKCCKQQIQHRFLEKRKKNACFNCKRKYLEIEQNENCRCKNEGGEQRRNFKGVQKEENVDREVLEIYTNKCCKVHVPQENQQVCEKGSRVENCTHFEHILCGDEKESKVMCNYSEQNHTEKYAAIKKCPSSVESLQVVPHLGEGDREKMVVQERISYDYSKEEKKTTFKSFFKSVSSWSGIFNRKPKMPTSEANDKTVSIQNVTNDHQLKEQREVTSFRKQTQNTEISQYSRNIENFNNKPYEFDTIFEENQVEHSEIKHTSSFQKFDLKNSDNKVQFPHGCQTVPQVIEVENVTMQTTNVSSFNNEPKLNKLREDERITNAEHVKKKPIDKNTWKLNWSRTFITPNGEWTVQFWVNVFSIFHEAISFFTSFALELLKFLLHSVAHPILWGTLQVISEYFFQPCLSITFESLIKPVFKFIQNVVESFRDICQPLAQSLGYFFLECSSFCKACRLVDVYYVNEECDFHKNP